MPFHVDTVEQGSLVSARLNGPRDKRGLRDRRTGTKSFMGLAVLLSLCAPTTLHAHEIVHKVSRGAAVVIELSYHDHSPFSDEQYEVYRRGEETPYQTGRTDALGRIVFVPDREGSWRIRAFSESGHGIDVTIEAGPESAVKTVADPGSNRYGGVVLGVVLILGVFMIVWSVLRRRAM